MPQIDPDQKVPDSIKDTLTDYANRRDIEVLIDYTNWRGFRSIRPIRPLSIFFGSNEWHKKEQWLLTAVDLNDRKVKTFAMKDIKLWTTRKKTR